MKKVIGLLLAVTIVVYLYQALYIKIEKLPCNNCFFQDKQMNCGPTALKMAMAEYNINIKLSDIEKETNFNKKQGITMLDMYNYTEKLGLKPSALRITNDYLSNVKLPCIAYLKQSHFAVIDSINTEGYCYMRDPSTGRFKTHISHLSKMWQGEVLTFQP